MRQRWLPLSLAFLLASCSVSTPVTVTNSSKSRLTQVVVSGSGFSHSIGTIEPGESATVQVKPAGESGIGIAFTAGQLEVVAPPEGYFEGGVGTEVHVVVDTHLKPHVSARHHQY